MLAQRTATAPLSPVVASAGEPDRGPDRFTPAHRRPQEMILVGFFLACGPLIRKRGTRVRCAYCDAEFMPKNQRRRFCSDKCRCASWQETRKARLARLEDRLSVALAEVQALRRSHVQR